MTNAFDKANQQEFDENTKVINAALFKIESNPDLKPTIAQLVKLTGLHRNTISNRGWPSSKLNAIKGDRHEKKLKSKENVKQQDVSVQLDQALDELLYWHHLASGQEEEISNLRRQLSLKSESMEFYKSETSSLRFKIKAFVDENSRLKSLLNSL
ncbi:hypothetical protein [Vibrio alginolyticus]|uniref:hypothetical protein n=1 Tax=Vibrio alginolyticus TaxID=663 RepID=UPI0028FC1AD7|nr:hypothetical protein [Vibrio alginolyticus]WNW05005.1 hypothetical protein RO483_08475 [Vibrio alginolyticus]